MARRKQDKIFEYKGWWIERIANSPYYYGARYDRSCGRVCRQSLGTDDLDQAKEALIKVAQVVGPKSGVSFLAPVLHAYYQEVTDAKPSADTARYAGRHILAFWGETARVSDLNERRQKEFWRWSRDQGHAPAYTARNLSVLSAAVRHGVKEQPPKIITSDRMIAEYLGVPEPQPRGWIPSDDELARLLDSLSHESSEHIFKYCLIALNTLARPEAVLNLAPLQIDYRFGLINLNPEGRRQTKKYRPSVRLTDTLAPWLLAWTVGDEPFVRFRNNPVGSVRNTFKRRSKALNLPGLNPYSLRHKMATELAARRVSRDSIQRQIGHKAPDMRTTERYIKNDPRHLADAKDAIEEYLTDLNRLTDRDLLRPDTSKILLTDQSLRDGSLVAGDELPLPYIDLEVVGGVGIEPMAPTMSR
jgi:integrase